MKKTRRLVLLAAVLCMVFSLTACANGEKNNPAEAQLDAVEIRMNDDNAPNQDVFPDYDDIPNGWLL